MNRANRRPDLLICVVLAVVTAAAFWRVLGQDFVEYDDQDYITQNPRVQAGLTWHSIQWAIRTGHAGNWHPLTWLSHMLDCQLFGLHATGHHITSLLFHVSNTVLLFILLRHMTGAIWRSAFVSALFAVHPLHVESVAWVAERKDVLSACFFMLTLLAYTQYVRRAGQSGPESEQKEKFGAVGLASAPPARAYYLLALGLFTLGLMSKAMLVTVPFVLLLLDYWPLGRLRPGKATPDELRDLTALKAARAISPTPLVGLIIEKIPFFILAVASSVVTFLVQRQAGAMGLSQITTLGQRFSNSLVSYCAYLLNTVWPTDLAAFYPFPKSIPVLTAVGAGAVLVAVSLIGISNARKCPHLAVGWFWFLGMLVPVIGFVQVGMQGMADRYTYLPLIGIFVVVAWGGAEFAAANKEWQSPLKFAAVTTVGICVFLTSAQVKYWQNTQTLWEHALAVTSNNAVAEYGLGVALARAGKYDQAAPHFVNAIRIRPDYAEAHNNLGLILVMKGDVEQGIEHYRAAQRAKLNTPELQFNLGQALAAKGDLNQAISAFRAALQLQPSFTAARRQLGIALATEGKMAEATNELCQALREQSDAQTHYYLALALTKEGRGEEAVVHYREALHLQPDWPLALNDLAWLLATAPKPELRDSTQAVTFAERACQLSQRREARFVGTLDACYAAAGRFAEAIATAKQARELALSTGQKDIAVAAEQRLTLYESGQAYHQ